MKLHLCYVDEAGCTGNLPSATSQVQPIFVLCGLVVPETSIVSLTHDFLQLKRTFNPALSASLQHDLDIITHEIKGAEDLRKPIRKKNRNDARRAIGFLDKTLAILEKHECQIIPNIYIKSPTVQFNSTALYARSVQYITNHFQAYLEENESRGILIADSRNHELNVRVSHSIFTQKFKASGDLYPRVLEMPVYGHSDNHAAIQITDILCSALLFPIASYVYCSGHINSVHVSPKYKRLKERYAEQLKNLSYRYIKDSYYCGGITVRDTLGKRNSSAFFL
ncbi:TPA: DUF3800 domain-containing protein [Vibrio vulnificus]|nr:DUF3800 domain-containing protein [Vibrio cholerae]RZR34060.1 DUF3800 domain-containing protein [Vibrio vulnificus]TLE07888.1 DUF3800 domain-containing protein [Vibrio cholerae]TLE13999.1 DUF3800 domain-containing protein [Vibrio cholerae]HAS8151838.1 DUF3800 domain-containing protein [Vibrio vulnificus]HAS8313115.1 DUF3800 domain-containing protein [Vibrio vulnificus]